MRYDPTIYLGSAAHYRSGYLSLSSSAPHLFGDRLDDFAAEVRALLADRSAAGIFWDWPGDTEIVLARKPGVPGPPG